MNDSGKRAKSKKVAAGSSPPRYIDLPAPGEPPQVPEAAATQYRKISQRTVYTPGVFNARTVRTLREVTVSGMKLVWNYRIDNKALQALSGQLDLKRINIYADTVHVDMPLKFPQAEVLIHARELIFTRTGSIDITPLSLEETPDPGQSVETTEGKTGLPGAQGANAGKIELNVNTILIPESADGEAMKRFYARGAAGQDGGKGGWLPLAQGSVAEPPAIGWDEIYNALSSTPLGTIPFGIPTLTIEQHQGLFAPIRTPKPLSLGNLKTCPAKLKDVHALSYDVTVHFPGGYFYYTNWNFKRGDAKVVPADGQDAYPSGRPGDGGRGGEILFDGELAYLTDDQAGADPLETLRSEHGCPLQIGAIADVAGGSPGTAMEVPGRQPSAKRFARVTLEISFKFKMVRHPWRTRPSRKNGRPVPVYTATEIAFESKLEPSTAEVTPKVGDTALAPVANAGPSGRVVQGGGQTGGWCEAYNAEAALAFARSACMASNRELARRVAEIYEAALAGGQCDTNPGQQLTRQQTLRKRQVKTELHTLRQRLDRDLDAFGNQLGWVPHLSMLGTLSQFQNLVNDAFDSMFLCYKIRTRWKKMENNVECFGASRDATSERLDASREQLSKAQDEFSDLQEQLLDAFREGDHLNSRLATLMSEIRSKAEIDVHNQALRLGETRVAFGSLKLVAGGLGLLAQLIPVGQPVLGIVGNVGSQAAGGAFGAIENLLVATLQDKDNPTPDSGSQIAAQAAKLVKPYQEQIATTVAKPFRQELDADIKKNQKSLNEVNKELKLLARDKKSLLNLLDLPESEISEQLERLTRVPAGRGVEEQKKLEVWVRQKVSERITTLEGMTGDYKKTLAALHEKESQAEGFASRAARLARKSTQIQAKAKDIVQKLAQLPGSAEDVYNGIRLLCISKEALAPQVAAAVDKLSGTEYQEPLLEISGLIERLGGHKEDLMRRMQCCEAALHDAANSINQCWDDLAALDMKLMGISGALDHAVYLAVANLDQRAHAMVAEQLYYFAKAYQYRFLKRVEPDFYDLNAFVEKIEGFLDYTDKADDGVEDIEDTQLTTDDFGLMYKMLEDRIKKKIDHVARDIQYNSQTYSDPWTISGRSLLDPDDFRKLNKSLQEESGGRARYEPVVFNFVEAGYAPQDAFKLRIMDLELTNIELADISDFNTGLNFKLRFQHSGVSILGDDRDRFLFRAQTPGERIHWDFNISLTHEGELQCDRVTPTLVDTEVLQKLTSSDSSTCDLLAAYWPGGASDITLQRISAGRVVGGEIVDFELKVKLEVLPADWDRKPAPG